MKNVYVFFGSEQLIIKNKIDRVIKDSGATEFNITTYDLDEVNLSEVVNDASTIPFMSENKVIIVKNPYFLSKSKTMITHDVKGFNKYLDNINDSTILIFDCTDIELDESKDYVKKLMKIGEVSGTKRLENVEMEGWLKRQFAILNVEIEDNAVKAFFNIGGKNLINLKNEVDKLINYIGDRKVVTVKDVNQVVTRELETDIFALTNAIIDKNKNKTISIYQDLIKSGRDSIQLFNLISKSMKDIYVTKVLLENGYNQKDITAVFKVSDGRAYYMVKNAKAFKTQDVENYIIMLSELDYKIKSGQIEKNSGIELLLFGLGK